MLAAEDGVFYFEVLVNRHSGILFQKRGMF